MEPASFQIYLSQVASRLRHDLKGGLITLKMGCESLSDEEILKPLLLEKTQELVDLSDKLVLLLRMGSVTKIPQRPNTLFREAVRTAAERFPSLDIGFEESTSSGTWNMDPDAVLCAFLELCENAIYARSTKLQVRVSEAEGVATVTLTDNGDGFHERFVKTPSASLELGQGEWGRSGLGLAIVQRCMLEHGGMVALQATSSGTQCQLKFPLERVCP